MSYTIVLKFSREWCVFPFFDAFKLLKFDRSECNLLMINNSPNDLLSLKLLVNLPHHITPFKSVQLIQTNRPQIDRYTQKNFKDVPIPFHTWTAYNSFQIHKLINRLITDDIHIQLEDDSLPHPNLINRLLEMMQDPSVDCATSPMPHRQRGFKVVGHNAYKSCKFNKKGFLLSRSNYPPHRTSVKRVSGTGYCNFALRKKAFQKSIKHIEDLKIRIIGSGSDVYFFRPMKKILCDFSLWGEHMFIEKETIYKNTIANTRQWDWQWNEQRGCYDLKFIDKEDGN